MVQSSGRPAARSLAFPDSQLAVTRVALPKHLLGGVTPTSDASATTFVRVPLGAESNTRLRNMFNAAAGSVGMRWTHGNGLVPLSGEISVRKAFLEPYGLEDQRPVEFTFALQAAIDTTFEGMEEKRRSLVAESYGALDIHTIRHTREELRAKGLNPAEVEFVYQFNARVIPPTNAIYASQQHPDWIWHMLLAANFGDELSRAQFMRVLTNAPCPPHGNNPLFSLVPYYPPLPRPYSTLWPKDITPGEIATVNRKATHDPAYAALLVPDVVVERWRGRRSHYHGTPIVFHRDFAAHFQTLAKVFDELAEISVTNVEGTHRLSPGLHRQLKAYAEYCREGEYGPALEATMDQHDGPLYVMWGATESYFDDPSKFAFQAEVSIRRPHRIEEQIGDLMGWFETQTAYKYDAWPHYTPRRKEGPFHFEVVEVVLQGGFLAAIPHMAVRGYNYPNYAYPGMTAEQYVSSHNHSALLFYPEFATDLFGSSYPGYAVDVDVMTTHGHEPVHRIGPARNWVVPSRGQPMGILFGRSWGDAEEPKADAGGFLLWQEAQRRGRISSDELEAIIYNYLVNQFRRYPGLNTVGGPHENGSRLAIGWLMMCRALKYHDNGTFEADFKRIPALIEELYKMLTRYQATGDKREFLKLERIARRAIPPEVDARLLDARRRYGARRVAVHELI